MKTLKYFAVAALMLLLACSAQALSPGEIIFQDGFEAYAAGSDIDGQGGWVRDYTYNATIADVGTEQGVVIDSGQLATVRGGVETSIYTRALDAPAEIGVGEEIATTWVLYCESGTVSRNEAAIGVKNATGGNYMLLFRHDNSPAPATSFWDIYYPGGYQRIYDDGTGGVKEGKTVVSQDAVSFYKRVYGAATWDHLFTLGSGTTAIVDVNTYLWASNWAEGTENPWWDNPALDSIVMYMVPEPGSIAALFMGLTGFAGLALCKRK